MSAQLFSMLSELKTCHQIANSPLFLSKTVDRYVRMSTHDLLNARAIEKDVARMSAHGFLHAETVEKLVARMSAHGFLHAETVEKCVARMSA